MLDIVAGVVLLDCLTPFKTEISKLLSVTLLSYLLLRSLPLVLKIKSHQNFIPSSELLPSATFLLEFTSVNVQAYLLAFKATFYNYFVTTRILRRSVENLMDQ
jgi:hypothetical protein